MLYRFDGTMSDVEPLAEPPALPFYGARRHQRFDLFELYKYVNPIALFRGQWQYKRPDGMSNPEFATWLAAEAEPIFRRLGRDLANVLKPAVKWGWFPCAGEGNDLIVYEEDGRTERLRFTFPRQREGTTPLPRRLLPPPRGRRGRRRRLPGRDRRQRGERA